MWLVFVKVVGLLSFIYLSFVEDWNKNEEIYLSKFLITRNKEDISVT